MSNSIQEKRSFYAVVLILAWCFFLLGFRMVISNQSLYTVSSYGLVWNLFLATIPLFWSAAFQKATQQKRPITAFFCFGLWLLFFPNAPYLLTDMVHFTHRPDVPVWYLLAMLLSCAAAGTLLGYISLAAIHQAINQVWGKWAGWLTVTSTLMLSAFGIYIGRFLRWNSWDFFTNPIRLAKTTLLQFTDAATFPHPVPVTLVYGVGLIIGYLVLSMTTFNLRETD